MHLDIATALNIVSTLAIVGALIFAALQVREVNTARREQASVSMILATHFFSVDLISQLPANATVGDIERSSTEMHRALFEFGVRLETIAYMVYQRMVRLETVDDLMGGVTLVYWSRAKAWTESERQRTENPNFRVVPVARHPDRKTARERVDAPAYLRDTRWRE